MDPVNNWLWSQINWAAWYYWSPVVICAWVSLCLMGRLGAPQTTLGRILRVTTTIGYWFAVVSPLMNVSGSIAFPILVYSWTGILYQQYAACRANNKARLRPDLIGRILDELVARVH